MKLETVNIICITLALMLGACGSPNDDASPDSLSDGSDQNETATSILQEDVPPELTEEISEREVRWELRGKLSYEDEYGTTSVEIKESSFTVSKDDKLEGTGKGEFVHEGPCLGAIDQYDFEISGRYDEDANMFIFDDAFTFNEELEDEPAEDIIVYDNTLDTCTLGQTLGESFAMFRPIIFLAAGGGNENIREGEILIPAITNEIVELTINEGDTGLQETGMGGYIFFEVVQLGD